MKHFFSKIFFFNSTVAIIILVCLLVYRKNNSEIIIKEKNIIIGDSNTECAINSDLIDNTINLSKSGESYFYSYIKIKNIVSNNKIEKIFLSFSPHNIFRDDEKLKISSNNRIYSDFIYYFPILSTNEIKFLFSKDYLSSFFSILKSPKYFIYKNKKFGGHLLLNRNRLQQKLKALKTKKKINWSYYDTDSVEVKYLKKIKKFLEQNDVEFYLINTPKRKELINHSNDYLKFIEFYNKELSEVKFYDFSSYMGEEKYFSDLIHLNSLGSYFFSKNYFEELTKN